MLLNPSVQVGFIPNCNRKKSKIHSSSLHPSLLYALISIEIKYQKEITVKPSLTSGEPGIRMQGRIWCSVKSSCMQRYLQIEEVVIIGKNVNDGSVVEKQLFIFYKHMILNWEFCHWFLDPGRSEINIFKTTCPYLYDSLELFNTQLCFQILSLS